MDAKYRDLWERDLPNDMLYQLAIYAVSGIGKKTATILYPAIDDIPTTQKIDVNDPTSNSKLASVILQPLNLKEIADYISNDPNELRSYVKNITS